MAVALTLATRSDDLVKDRSGPIDLPRLRQALRLSFKRSDRVGVVGAELRPHQRQRLLVELQRPVVLAGVGIAVGEVVHAMERVGVVGPELRPRQRQRLLVELQRPVVLASGDIAVGEVDHAVERVGVVGPELRLL